MAQFDAGIEKRMERINDSWKELEDWLPSQNRKKKG
jgi:hypothetical protein